MTVVRCGRLQGEARNLYFLVPNILVLPLARIFHEIELSDITSNLYDF